MIKYHKQKQEQNQKKQNQSTNSQKRHAKGGNIVKR